ncbi:MAG TPA: complex I NDUFA9 subunit family protein [Novosphingobium sp.]|nr:complex I NDUFA9 subunit family protein [Novosphingobium sp.]
MAAIPESQWLADRMVVLIGASGFVGRHVAQALLATGARLRLASRHPEKAYDVQPLAGLGQAQWVACDVTRPETVAPLLDGAAAVVNLAGAFAGDLDAVQGRGAGRIAALAAQAGARAYVHVSAIGADAASRVAYARTKAEGEAAVQAAFPQATILRPSVIFGADDNFLNMFGALMAMMPALPVFAPHARLQPVCVDDVARGVAAALLAPAQHGGRTYELAGPQVLTMLEIMQAINVATGRHRCLLPLPDGVARAIAALPGTLISSDQYRLLLAGNVAGGDCPGLADMGITPLPMGLQLDRWMARYRPSGRFGRKS